MPAYHSAIPAEGKKFIGNVPVLPLRITAKGTGRGPAPPTITANEEDIVDESLNLFKANILFTSFEVTLNNRILRLTITLFGIFRLERSRTWCSSTASCTSASA